MKKTVLCFVVDRKRGQLLMIHKKKGQGAGKWNVPGGKMQESETAEAAAIRETQEETGLIPSGLRLCGELEFRFPKGGSWDNDCKVFLAESFAGILQPENDECSAHWIPLTEIPYSKMWESDQAWAPLVFSETYFKRSYRFDENDRLIP